jgi:hypothetical protein
MGFTGYILWIKHYWLTFIYFSFYALTNIFQSYYCVSINCPYIGKFCPAVAGIMPTSWIAKLLKKLHPKPNKKIAEVFALLGALMLLCLVIFPLYWLFQYHIVAFIGYLLGIMVYAFAFLLTICPVCASRELCPGGQMSIKLERKMKKDMSEK